MNDDAFWALIDELSRRPGDRDERLEWLTGRLLRRPATESAEFQTRLERACEKAHTRELWRAANRIEGGFCGDDGFHYFTLWLVAQGSGVYGAVLADPDALAELPGIRALAGRHVETWADDEWPEWEELDYAAEDAFNELTGEEGDDGEAFLDAVEEAEDAAVAAGEWGRREDPEGWEAPEDGEVPGGPGEGWEEDGERRRSRPEGVALPRLAALFPVGAPAP
ncbi:MULTISPECIES: DUF4240 domain-containing protein [unclassified Streptomyces]|uniref:DUF4240 domain-containing protein n=1 Tax=unclassified Streptomyces TaxID=2593676 RepID=UPI001CB74CE1|nr:MULTISPECIES: DUF4240 domain-containing protein [unclassified Streptomyces]